MLDIIFYIKLISGLGFIFASFLSTREYNKNPKKYKYKRLATVLFLLAGIFQLISATAYLTY